MVNNATTRPPFYYRSVFGRFDEFGTKKSFDPIPGILGHELLGIPTIIIMMTTGFCRHHVMILEAWWLCCDDVLDYFRGNVISFLLLTFGADRSELNSHTTNSDDDRR